MSVQAPTRLEELAQQRWPSDASQESMSLAAVPQNLTVGLTVGMVYGMVQNAQCQYLLGVGGCAHPGDDN